MYNQLILHYLPYTETLRLLKGALDESQSPNDLLNIMITLSTASTSIGGDDDTWNYIDYKEII